MIQKNKKKEGGISPTAAVVTGAVIGAGAVVAGVAALQNEKNRAKAQKVFNQVKNQAKDYMNKLEKTAQEAHKEAETSVTKGKKEVKKLADVVKDDSKSKK